MESLDQANDIAIKLRETLDAEVLRAQGERTLIRRMDAEGLIKRAQARGALTKTCCTFNVPWGVISKKSGPKVVCLMSPWCHCPNWIRCGGATVGGAGRGSGLGLCVV